MLLINKMIPQPVPGFDNLYLDENGQPYECINDQFLKLTISSSSNYNRVSAFKDGKKMREHLHVLMALTFLGLDATRRGIKSDSLQVDHIDGNKRNNKLENLQVVTKRENFNRAWKAGSYSRNGYASKGKAKKSLRRFTSDQIQKMRDLRDSGMSYRKIAKQFDCTHIAIYQIINGTTYQDMS